MKTLFSIIFLFMSAIRFLNILSSHVMLFGKVNLSDHARNKLIYLTCFAQMHVFLHGFKSAHLSLT